jgi:hypothetical protein
MGYDCSSVIRIVQNGSRDFVNEFIEHSEAGVV